MVDAINNGLHDANGMEGFLYVPGDVFIASYHNKSPYYLNFL